MGGRSRGRGRGPSGSEIVLRNILNISRSKASREKGREEGLEVSLLCLGRRQAGAQPYQRAGGQGAGQERVGREGEGGQGGRQVTAGYHGGSLVEAEDSRQEATKCSEVQLREKVEEEGPDATSLSVLCPNLSRVEDKHEEVGDKPTKEEDKAEEEKGGVRSEDIMAAVKSEKKPEAVVMPDENECVSVSRCDSELAAALNSFSTESLSLSLETLAVRRKALQGRSSSSTALQGRSSSSNTLQGRSSSSTALQGISANMAMLEHRSSLPCVTLLDDSCDNIQGKKPIYSFFFFASLSLPLIVSPTEDRPFRIGPVI